MRSKNSYLPLNNRQTRICSFGRPKRLLFLIIFVFVFVFLIITQNILAISVNLNFRIYSNITTTNGKWTVNRNILQYSAYLQFDKNSNRIIVDHLVLFEKPYENEAPVKSDVRCIVKNKPKNLVYKLDVSKIVRTIFMPIESKKSRYFWKIQCKLDNVLFNNTNADWQVALVDKSDYKLNSEDNDSTQLSMDYINYQIPKAFDITKPKKKAIAHCVHMMRAINEYKLKRLIQWLHIQKRLGIDVVRFYFYQVHSNIEKKLYQAFGNRFIDIVHYKMGFKDVCEKQLKDLHAATERLQTVTSNDQNRNNEAEVEFYTKLFRQCEFTYDRHFNLTRGYTYNSHERINTNDCFYNFRYEYEYVTNYDFDEIIFPREYATRYDGHKMEDCTQNDKNMTNTQIEKALDQKSLSLYEYADRLFNKNGKSKTTSLLFEHVIFIPFTYVQNLTDLTGNFSITAANNKKINFRKGSVKTENLSAKLKIAQCFLIKLANTSSMLNKFGYSYGIVITTQAGKSIYNTDLTDGMNQHYIDNKAVSTANQYKVPTDLGYLNHMREDVDKFFNNQTLSTNDFFIDLEYLLFILKYFGQNFTV